MPRLTDERRESRRTGIVAAARRCFARDGFHQTSMPDIAAEAGLSPGASYRYFAGKDDLVLEVAGQAFGAMFGGMMVGGARPDPGAPSVTPGPDAIVAEAVAGVEDRDEVEELLRCGVAVWSELLRHEELRHRAAEGFEAVRGRLAATLRRGQAAGSVPDGLDADHGARVIMALLHGFMLQRAAFGLDDVDGFLAAVKVLLARS